MNQVWIITLVEAALLLVYCFYYTWFYANKERTPFLGYFFTILGWFLGFMMILIVPLDIFKVIACNSGLLMKSSKYSTKYFCTL